MISFDEARFTQTRDKAYIVKFQRCMTTPDKCGLQIKSAITVGKKSINDDGCLMEMAAVGVETAAAVVTVASM